MTPSIPAGFTTTAAWGLVIVVLVAATTRLVGLGSLDVWNDEVYSHDASSDLLVKLLRWETVSNESSSPWPFIEMKVARQFFGEASPLTLRMPSALHGIASTVLFYLIVGYIVSWPAAIASALLLAVNPLNLEWAREGRMYTQWLTATVLVIGVCHLAVRDVRDRGGPWHSWRWWLLGMLFMLTHAMNVMGAMTIAGVALALGVFIVAEFFTNRTAARQLFLGSALAGGVYLGSWGLTGIAKALMLAKVSKAAGNYVPATFGEQFHEYITALPGHVPLVVAVLLWLLCAAGLIVLARRGHWRFALLLALASMGPWLAYGSITKSHFWAPRYAFTGMLVFAGGIGVVLASLWQGQLLRHRAAGIAAALTLGVGSSAFAAPYLHEIFFVPKMSVRSALKPIQQHAAEGEVLMLFPDYYISFNSYQPYKFGGKVKAIRGPKGTWLDGCKECFASTFDELYTRDSSSPDSEAVARKIPPAAWLFMLQWEEPGPIKDNWKKRIAQAEPVLAAYGVTIEQLHALVGDNTHTLTVRVSRDEHGKGRVDHAVATPGRRFR